MPIKKVEIIIGVSRNVLVETPKGGQSCEKCSLLQKCRRFTTDGQILPESDTVFCQLGGYAFCGYFVNPQKEGE